MLPGNVQHNHELNALVCTQLESLAFRKSGSGLVFVLERGPPRKRRQGKKNYVGRENPHINKGRGTTLFHDPTTSKLRSKEARQAEKEDGSSNKKESKMKAERLEFQAFNSKQSQAQSACQPRKAKLTAEQT
eukprot:1139900-Pelagomonas_calceolata.AAC.11